MINQSERDIAEKVSIATTTFYKEPNEVGKLRANLALKTVKEAQERGYDIQIVDGGSFDKFLRELERRGVSVHEEAQRGMGPGRRQVIGESYKVCNQIDSEREIIAWMEPEKDNYVREIYKTAEPILNRSADSPDLVIPDRGHLGTYPIDQQHAENFGNEFFYNLTGKRLDMWSGPRTFTNEKAHYFLSYKGKYGDLWDSIFIPVLDMICDQERFVESVKINYTHPKDQTENETGNAEFTFKRFKQLENLVPALRDHWLELKGRKS